MIRILQIVHSMPIAGTEKLVYDMMPLFSSEFHFVVVCLDELGVLGKELQQQKKPIFCMNRKPGIDFSLPRKIAKICRDHKIDILHCHQYTPYFYGCLARIFHFSSKVIFTEHGRHYPDIVSIKRKVVNQLLNLLTNAIVGVSQFPAKSLVTKEKLPSKKIQVIYNGIDLSRLKNRKNKEEIRKQLKLSHQDKIVGFVGRLHSIKDPLMLLKAFKEVTNFCPNAKLVIVGDGNMMTQCRRFCQENDLQKYVHFLGLRRDVLDIMQLFDVLVLSSLSEATSITLLEAMASGVASACTDVGGNAEIVKDGTTGLLSKRGDNEQLATNIVRILTDDKLRKKMGHASRNRANQFFTMKHMIQNYELLYYSLSE